MPNGNPTVPYASGMCCGQYTEIGPSFPVPLAGKCTVLWRGYGKFMSIRGRVLRSNVDMTQGRPLNVIFSFALPLLMGNLFNQLYNVVDTAIVGRALGADALAAVGSTGNINACLFLLLAGLATGVSVIVSQYWGAERYDELRRLLGTFLTLLLAASVVMSLLGVLLAGPMLRLLQVPENLLDAGVTYLRITAGFLLGNACITPRALCCAALGIPARRWPLWWFPAFATLCWTCGLSWGCTWG